MSNFKIKNRSVGDDYPPLVIAEIGINHGGSIDLAIHLADKAIKAGAEVIKHQTHVVDDEMSEEAQKVKPGNANKSIYEDLNSLNKINLAFALGKAYEDIKNFDRSFEFYKEANFLHNRRLNFSMDKEKLRFNKIKRTFCESLYEKHKESGYKNASPIFILGMPRSGTTLIEQILSSHRDVFGGDEQLFISDIAKCIALITALLPWTWNSAKSSPV